MDFESLFVEISPHILKMLIDIILNQLKCLVGLLGIHFFSLPPSVLSDPERREGFFNLINIADGAGNCTRRLLLLKGRTVLEPALKLMSI